MNAKLRKILNCKRQGRALLGVVALLGALTVVAALRPALSRATAFQPAFVLTNDVQREVNTSAFGLILGEMRASMADLMWVKTERYFHRGVAYTAHLDAVAMSRTGEVKGAKGSPAPAIPKPSTGASANPADAVAADEDDDDDDVPGGLKGLIPEARKDYRGYIGVIHRAIQPWKAPGAPDEHTAGDELVPWYRLLTLSNPHHWRGYMIGSWWLIKMQSKDPRALAEAAGFIEEGIRNNPEIFQLQLMDGRVKNQQGRWRDANAAFERAIALAQKIRPTGGQEKEPVWSLSDEEDFAFSLRYIPFLQWRKLNDLKSARASLERGLKILPHDGPLRNMKAQLDRIR